TRPRTSPKRTFTKLTRGSRWTTGGSFFVNQRQILPNAAQEPSPALGPICRAFGEHTMSEREHTMVERELSDEEFEQLISKPMTELSEKEIRQINRKMNHEYSDDERRQLLPAIRSCGVKDISPDFDGCGDGRQINKIELQPAGIDPEAVVLRLKHVSLLGPNARQPAAELLPAEIAAKIARAKTVQDLIIALALAYDSLRDAQPGWEIDAGSRSSVSVDVLTGRISIDMNIRETTERIHKLNYVIVENRNH